MAERDLIERYVERVIIKPQALEVRLVPPMRVYGAYAIAEKRSVRN